MRWLNGIKISNLGWVLTSMVLISLFGIASMALAAGENWTARADMPTQRFGLSTCVVNGKIYAIGGGHSLIGAYLSPVETYDPETDTWTRKADMPTARAFLSTSVVNGKIYAIGGSPRDNTSSPIVEEYDPVTDTWTRKADMPTSRTVLSTSVVNGRIYAFGGRKYPGNIDLSTVEEYDPATNTWTSKANMPHGRFGLSTSVVNGKIYAIGGTLNSFGATGISTVEEYNPATDTWTAKTAMPTARKLFSTSVVNGKIYAIGGATATNVISIVEEYNPETDNWTRKTDIPTARQILSTSAVNGKIYAIGGTPASFPSLIPCSTVEVYETRFIPSDYNRDGIVDIKDLLILIENWGGNELLVDISPSPYGDGIVDILDLEVLMSYWGLKVDDILAHWALDETEGDVANDIAGDHHGSLYGEPIWQPAGGKFAGALEFDGIDDYVSTPFVLDPVKGSFSVFAWIKGSLPGQVIISQTGDFGDTLININPSGKLMTELGSIYFGDLESEIVVTDGLWHHVGFVYDMDSLHRLLYVDGVLVAEDATFVSGSPSGGGLHIGASKDLDATSFFAGLIDDVRIYNVALSVEEIAALVQ